jgi:putative DNA primase/helicase
VTKPQVTSVALPLTDVGNAERLVHRYGRRLLHTQRGWHVYTGRRWELNSDLVMQLAIKVTHEMLGEAINADVDHSRLKELHRHALRSQGKARIDAMISLARSSAHISVDVEDLDRDRFLLNVQNGTLDLRSGVLYDHDRADRITKIAPVEYDANATCAHWDAHMRRVFPDRALREYFQKAIAYSFTGDVREQVFFIVIGDGGEGKSTTFEVLRRLVGIYARTSRMDAFTISRHDANAASPYLARLPGVRLVTASELAEGVRLNEPMVKEITGGDRIATRGLYKEPFEFYPQFKLWLVSNNLPVIRGSDTGIWRRVRVIPFASRIKRPDKDFGKRLDKEHAGILNWVVEGCRKWRAEGLEPPRAVQRASAVYRDEQNPLRDFLEECCVIGSDHAIPRNEMWASYQSWANASGVSYPISRTALYERLRRMGIDENKRKGQRMLVGVGIKGFTP